MNDDDRKLLTEYLGECWHEMGDLVQHSTNMLSARIGGMCSKCLTSDITEDIKQRTFTTREDLYDLFGKIYEAGRWEEFEAYAWDRWPDVGRFKHGIGKYTAWLFCLSGDGYEERCQMMTDWIKEANHE